MKAAICLLSLLVSFSGFASELDRDVSNQEGSNYAGTVVLRIDETTNKVEMFETNEVFSDQEIEAVSSNFQFQEVEQANLKNELDQEAGSSSWYFYYNYGYNYGWNSGYYNNYYYYPTYYRYGYSYRPYYRYSYNRYRYYCYRWY